MFMVLPSFVVKFEPEPGQVWNWRVNTEEGLEAFCKVLRLNGVASYSVARQDSNSASGVPASEGKES